MKRTVWGPAALLLAAALLLNLSACGGEKAPETAEESGTVFVPEFVDLPGGTDQIVGACLAGDTVCYVSAAPEKVRTEIGGFVFVDSSYRYSLYLSSLGGETAERLSAYEPIPLPEGMSGSAGTSILGPAADGGLWVQENQTCYSFQLPQDFDPAADDRWAYRTASETRRFYRLLDPEGREQNRIDAGALADSLGVDLDAATVFEPAFDADSRLYLTTKSAVYVLSPALELLFTLEGENMSGGAVRLSDGGMAQYTYVRSAAGGSEQLRRIDPAAGAWGESLELPSGVYEVCGGSGDFLFYYSSGDGLYGWEESTGRARKLFSWLDADLNQNGLVFISQLADGRLAVMSHDWEWGDDGSWPLRLALLTETDSALAPRDGRTVLTLGTVYLWTETEKLIQAFNRSSDQYYIQARVYYELAGGEDFQAAQNLLTTELNAGKIPDILYVESIPFWQLVSKGMLEDLWPWIDSDPELGREALMVRVLDAASRDGKLYQVFDRFEIETLLGAPAVVGDRMGWTVGELEDAWESMPEGCCLLDPGIDGESLLDALLKVNLDQLVDWNSGHCRFDSEEFKALLELCASVRPEDYQYDPDYSDPADLIAAGEEMLSQSSLLSFNEIQLDKAIFGGSVSFIGYPTLDGSCGSSFAAGSMGLHFAMSASCKDKEGAWAFMREALLPQYASRSLKDASSSFAEFRVNRTDFEWMAKKAMTPVYETDKQGNLVLNDAGEPIEISVGRSGRGHISADLYAVSQEEYDQIMALYNSIDRMTGSDEALCELVEERAAAYFAGDRSLEETVKLIQSAAGLYLSENT